MVDVAPVSASDGPAGETPNQKLARLRREKRQKRMAEEGEDRLARIKALNGGVAPPEEILGGPAAPPPAVSVADDPEEVDISQNTSGYGTPSRPATNAQQNPLAAAMFQMQQQEASRGQPGGQAGGEEDPMVQMMQQLAGLMGGDPNDPNAAPPEIPMALKALMGGMGGMGGGAAVPAPPATGSTYIWRIIHAVVAFVLAGYIALTSTFNGSKLARGQSVYTEEAVQGWGARLFYIFCTVELVLQSSRFFMEKGQLQGNGMLAKIANSGFVPEPYAGYVRMIGRYIGIFQTIVADAMVVVFVFGLLAWWRGASIT